MLVLVFCHLILAFLVFGNQLLTLELVGQDFGFGGADLSSILCKLVLISLLGSGLLKLFSVTPALFVRKFLKEFGISS